MGIRLSVVLLIACTKSTVPTVPGPDLDNMRMYEPLAMKTEAKLPDHAVILGTDEKGGSTVLKIPTAPASATVDAPGASGLVTVKLTTAANADGNVHVGIYEERVGTTGTQWRASVWVAATVAAQTLGKDLTDFNFGASAADSPDGPAASALIAGGFLASMTGRTIDPSVTVIGVIDPDGTIGPAAGLPDKVRAAVAAGKKTIGYPAGMRRVGDADVVDLAKAGGATAVEIGTVHDVYKLLTGKPLPASVPVAVAAMALEADRAAAIDRHHDNWYGKVIGLEPRRRALLNAKLSKVLGEVAEASRASFDRAGAMRKTAPGAALVNIISAWGYAQAAADTYDVLLKVRAGDLAGAIQALETAQPFDTSSGMEKVANLRPNTVGGHLLMMGAYQSALRGSGLASVARLRIEIAKQYLQTLDGKSKADLESAAITDVVVEQVLSAELLVTRSTIESVLAVQRLDFEAGKSINYMCNVPNVIRLATSYRSAAAAGVEYLESLLVEPLAKSGSLTVDEARMRVGLTEPDYLVAYALAHLDALGAAVKSELGENSLAWNLLLLAGAERAYAEAAQLTAKHYSFADANKHAGALAALVANAERMSRAAARAAEVATGAIPVQSKLSYQLATAQRARPDSQEDALASYWAATAYAQAAVMLARN